MPRRESHDILFEPLEIRGKVLNNRFYGVPYGYGSGALFPRSHAEHRNVQAEGGWAAICLGVTSATADIADHPLDRLVDDTDRRRLQFQCEVIQAHGALAGVELSHVGADSPNKISRLPTFGPSQIASWRRPFVTPKAMELGDIKYLQDELARAASMSKQAGFDIICLYGAFSYLPAQFLSPFYNKRTDNYGGSLENRARFWLESLERIREAAGDACILSTRLAAAGLSDVGISLEETLQFIQMADPLVDLWDVTVGAAWEKDSGSSRFFAEGWQLEWSGRVRDVTAKPIVGVGRLTNPDRMAEILRSGAWDLIGCARPRIADPFLPKKIEEGRYDEIRECTGSNLCIASMYQMQLTCFQNPTVGEEYRRGWHPESVSAAKNADNDVLVLGAGPAGMECALMLARRGMRRVHLVDANAELGGALRWISTLPTLAEWGRAIDYRKIQLEKAKQVQLVPETALKLEDVLTYGAEIVVVATGSTWATNGINFSTHESIPGADASHAHILTPEQIVLDGKRPPGQKVVVYDTDGNYMAPVLAEKLKLEGFEVEIITSMSTVSPYADETLEGNLLRQRLRDTGIVWQTSTQIDALEPGGILTTDALGRRGELEADGVVLVTQRVSTDALYCELVADQQKLKDEFIDAVYRIGDCVAPRSFADVIFDGHRLAREIDSPNPAVALPVLPDGPDRIPA